VLWVLGSTQCLGDVCIRNGLPVQRAPPKRQASAPPPSANELLAIGSRGTLSRLCVYFFVMKRLPRGIGLGLASLLFLSQLCGFGEPLPLTHCHPFLSSRGWRPLWNKKWSLMAARRPLSRGGFDAVVPSLSARCSLRLSRVLECRSRGVLACSVSIRGSRPPFFD